MEKKEHIMSILQEMGFAPRYDDDGDIHIMYQMKNIFFMIHEDDDDNFLSILLPQFASVDEGEESLALATCNKMTRDLKFTKTFVEPTFKNISSTCEFFYVGDEDLKNSIEKALLTFSVIRREYMRFKKDLTD